MAVGGGIAAGLGGAVAWGTADFFAKRVVDRIGQVWTVLLGLFIGALPLLALALWQPRPQAGTTEAWGALIGAAMGNVIGGLFLYDAFARGRLSVVSPVSSCYPAVTVTLAALIFGAEVLLQTAMGIGAILVGIAAISQETKVATTATAFRSTGVVSALLATLSFGLAFFWLVPAIDAFGPYFSIAAMRFAGLPVAAAAVLLVPSARHLPRGIPWGFLLTVALLDSAAFLSFASGIAVSSVVIVAPLSALYPAVTVAFAMHNLKERFNRVQGLGLVLILAGVMLVSAS